MSDLTTDGRIRMERSSVKGRVYHRYVVELGKIGGKRKRRTFKTYEDAEDFLAACRQIALIGHRTASPLLLRAPRQMVQYVMSSFGFLVVSPNALA